MGCGRTERPIGFQPDGAKRVPDEDMRPQFACPAIRPLTRTGQRAPHRHIRQQHNVTRHAVAYRKLRAALEQTDMARVIDGNLLRFLIGRLALGPIGFDSGGADQFVHLGIGVDGPVARMPAFAASMFHSGAEIVAS